MKLEHLKHLQKVFPNRAALYQRIDRAIANPTVLKVGIVPFVSPRQTTKGILESLVADPIDDSKWAGALKDRPLTKNVLVTQSPSFDYVETRNFTVEYPVPFRGPPTEYLEVTSWNDCHELLANCDIHIFASSEPAQALRAPVPSEHPVLLVLDNEKLAAVDGLPRPLSDTETEVVVDAAKALEGDELLRQSSSNITAYLEKLKASHIADLQQELKPEKVRKQLLTSIFNTCEDIAAEPPHNQEVAADALDLRHQWALAAHRELQLRLRPAIRGLLNGELAWWKLYARTDDVDATAIAMLARDFMPEARANLQNALGRAQGFSPGLPGQVVLPEAVKEAIPGSQFEGPLDAAHAVAVAAAGKLQNAALGAVLQALAVQLPLGLLSVAGVYFAGYSWYSMAALASLGLVVGLRRLQKCWFRAGERFETTVSEAVRAAIGDCEQELYSLHEAAVQDRSTQQSEQKRVLEAVKKAVESN